MHFLASLTGKQVFLIFLALHRTRLFHKCYNQMHHIEWNFWKNWEKNLNFSIFQIIFTLINWNICNIYNTPNLFSSPRMSAFGKVKKLSKMFILIGKHNIWIIYINFRCFIKFSLMVPSDLAPLRIYLVLKRVHNP